MGWDLFGWSFSVIRKQKQLIWFPIFSTAAALVALFLFSLGRDVHQIGSRDLVWILPAYFVISFVIVFFNCALAACAQAHFSGQEASLGYGMRHAAARLTPILGWALLSATVGFLLRLIDRRASWAGKIARFVVGVAWGMTTYLVVPVLIAEDRGPLASLRRSAQLVKDTWSDQIVAEIRFGWRALVFFIPCLIIGVIGANGFPALLPVAAACFIIAAAGLSAARGIFEVALYRYAAYHETPAGWSPKFTRTLGS
jgi:hypothetical protein